MTRFALLALAALAFAGCPASEPAASTTTAPASATCTKWVVQLEKLTSDTMTKLKPEGTAREAWEVSEGWEPFGYAGTSGYLLTRKCVD